jgi:hypothetical protein
LPLKDGVKSVRILQLTVVIVVVSHNSNSSIRKGTNVLDVQVDSIRAHRGDGCLISSLAVFAFRDDDFAYHVDAFERSGIHVGFHACIIPEARGLVQGNLGFFLRR